MALLPAVRLLLVRGLVNRVRAQLRRIRQPRYLVATVLGLLYWGWYLGHVLGGVGTGRRGLPAAWLPSVELGLAGLALALTALTWIFGGDRGALTFTEAEIQFLFPAPLSRRQLIHYKLLRSLALGLLGSAFTTLVFGRTLGGPPVLFALGSWLALATFSFHGLAASFTRAGLARHGLAGLRRGLLAATLVVAALALLAWAGRQVDLPALGDDPRAWLAALAPAIDGSPLGWLLWPVRAPIRLALARDLQGFLLALPGALLVLGLHYAWVMAAVFQFEDGAVAEAQRRARLVEAARAGGARGLVRAKGKRRPPFRLAPRGRPEVAFLWKGLIAGGRTVGLRGLLVIMVVLPGSMALALGRFAGSGALALASSLAALLWVMVLLLGPTLARADLRTDLPNLEALRTLPLTGAQVVRGELLAPLVTLTALQWLTLPLAAALPAPVSLGVRAALALAAALVGPAFTLVSLTLRNGFVVILPGWAPTGVGRTRGPETLGLGIIALVGNLLALALALVPAGLLGGLVLLAGWPLLGLHGAPLAALAAAGLLCFEAWLATGLLGGFFDRLDPSAP
jgi:ABC-2 type transport system permease protein